MQNIYYKNIGLYIINEVLTHDTILFQRVASYKALKMVSGLVLKPIDVVFSGKLRQIPR